MSAGGRLIAVEGASRAALSTAIRTIRADAHPRTRLSEWDASRIFSELSEGDDGSAPSARVLVLLYATDLAFRLRRDIQPALAEGRSVIAAPYVATAVAFGRAAGLRATWLSDLFSFAPAADESHIVQASASALASDIEGFVEFGCTYMKFRRPALTRERMIARTAAFLTRTRALRGAAT